MDKLSESSVRIETKLYEMATLLRPWEGIGKQKVKFESYLKSFKQDADR